MQLYEVELRNYCYMVERGKPAASMALQDRHLEEAARIVVEEYALHTYSETLCEEWVTFWIYRHIHILKVIQSTPQTPKTAFDHWVLGKLYGYDEAAIEEFLSTLA